MENLYHYIIVRNDLTKGVALAQTTHAAGESNPEGKKCYAVVLECDSEKLHEIEEKALHKNVKHVAIREPDLPFDNDLMAIGFYPTLRSENKKLRRIVSNLPLAS